MTEREHISAAKQENSEHTEARGSGNASACAKDGTPSRPRSFTTPPPDPAEALYYEGMAAYQHRNWEEALERFGRLKKLQPNRPGLDALLDEVRWFLQLQAAVPNANTGKADENTRSRDRLTTSIRSRPRWQTWGLVLLGIIGITALLLIVFQGRFPWNNATERQARELYNRGQARLTVGDYEGAQAAFQKLLDISPNDPEALLGLSRAERQQTLAQDYAAAEAAIAEEDWDTAAAELNKILAIDSSYADAQAKTDFVAQRQRLAGLYNEGSRLYDLGQWEDAIAQFEKIQELDNSYRTEAVNEFLFVCYLNAGQALIDGSNGEVAPVQQAIGYFSSALAIHPRNHPAADARRLGSLYLDALRALAEGDTADAQARLEAILAEEPTYAAGQVAQQLYNLLIKQAEQALHTGNIPAAIKFYQQAQTVAVPDQTAAIEGETYARSITPTPTPRPTFTPGPEPVEGPSPEPVEGPSPEPVEGSHPEPVEGPTPYAVVRTGALNVRSGPGLAYPVLGQISTNNPLAITGRNTDSTWLRVCCIAGKPGWVATGLITVQGSLAALPIVIPPPAAATPSPTPAEQVVCVMGQVRDTNGGKPLAGWTVTLQTSGGGSQAQHTDSKGFYRFPNLQPGTYTVSEQLEPDWHAISPPASTVTISPAAECTSVDFWNEYLPPTPPR